MSAYSDPALNLIVTLAQPTLHDGVLDVGAGAGEVAIALAEMVKSVEALDDRTEFVEEAHRLAAAMGAGNVNFSRGDPYALPFGDGAFSLVVCHDALHRLPEPVAALKEMARVLSRGGRLVVAEVSVGDLVDPYLNEVAKLREPAHRRYYRASEYEELFARAGLATTERAQGKRTVDLDYWLESAGVGPERAGLVRARMRELPVKVQTAIDLAFSDRLVSFTLDVVAYRLQA